MTILNLFIIILAVIWSIYAIWDLLSDNENLSTITQIYFLLLYIGALVLLIFMVIYMYKTVDWTFLDYKVF